MGKRILYIWDADYPWDVRVEKICQSLMSDGHEVHIASRNLKKRPIFEEDRGLCIHRLRFLENNRLNYVLSFPAFFSPLWKKFLDSIIISNQIDLVVVRDLPMAIAGLWAGKRHSLPVIFDMAEDYVALIRGIWRRRKFQGFNLVVRNPSLATIVERYALPRFNHVFVVVDEAIRVAMRAGTSPENITIIGNTPMLTGDDQVARNDHILPERLSNYNKHYLAVYTGGIQLGRGLQTVFEAIPYIINKIPNFLFVVVGAGYAVEQLKNFAREISIDKYIFWVGWVDHEKLFEYLYAANVGIIPHYRSAHVDSTVPNKIFDYMACGLPVIASDSPPMQRIVEETSAGLVFQSGNSVDLAKAVIEVYSSQEDYGKRGRKAVDQKYNWSIDEKRLFNVINKI